MRYLLDTHLLIWSALTPRRLSKKAREIIDLQDTELNFSVASIWEIAIKHARGRAEFVIDPSILRQRLLDNLYIEIPVTGAHAIAIVNLPPIHKDPFDRLLIAQAITEDILLLTADKHVAKYPAPVRLV